MALLTEVTTPRYACIRSTRLINEMKITSKVIHLRYLLIKHTPKIELIIYWEMGNTNTTSSNGMIERKELIIIVDSATTSVMNIIKVKSLEKVSIKVTAKQYKKENDRILAAQIEGGYEHYLQLMIDMHLEHI